MKHVGGDFNTFSQKLVKYIDKKNKNIEDINIILTNFIQLTLREHCPQQQQNIHFFQAHKEHRAIYPGP